MSLPENYRQVVILREMRGEDTVTTAWKLRITPANVKVRLQSDRHEENAPTD